MGTNPRVRFGVVALLLVVVACAAMPNSAAAQGVVPGPPRPGMVLVDDMWLPGWALEDDGLYEGPSWPGGLVPYVLTANLTPAQVAAFLGAVEYLEAVCGVDFVPRAGHPDYLVVRMYAGMGGAGQSEVGISGGEQELAVGPTFLNPLAYAHELMHALGFKHEQSRPDRDTYVTINTANIASNCGTSGTASCVHNFQLFNETMIGSYDFLSVMHYQRNAFSSNGMDTITCNPGYTAFAPLMGLSQSLSYGDANALVSRYGPTTVHPTLDGITPAVVAGGSGNTTIRIFGTGFYRGSNAPFVTSGPTVLGVLGTQVTVDGIGVSSQSVTYVSPTEIRVTVPAFHFVNPGCLSIRTENAFGGTSAPWSLGVAPSAAMGGFWAGAEVNAHAGSAVVGIGDVDADGYDDVVVGAFGTTYGGTQYGGRVSCCSGRDGATLWSKLGLAPQGHGTSLANVGDVDGDGIHDVLDGAPGTYGATFYGNVQVRSGVDGALLRTYVSLVMNDGFGHAVASAGDVNQDGVPDHLVGVPNSDQARLYSGANGAPIRTLTGAVGTRFGAAVAGGFDLTGDGIPDQAVGAPQYPSGSRGRVYLYDGASGALVMSFFGDAVGDRLGWSLAMIPAPDGSGSGALVVGAPGSTSSVTGYARLFGASASGYASIDTLTGNTPGGRFGWSVASAGDLDQDGMTDVAVGAPDAASNTGQVRIHSGRTGYLLESDAGGAPNDRFGWSVAAAGDTNGDGVPDLVAGAIDASPGCAGSGYARTIHRSVPPAQRKVMLSEVFFGQPAGVELTNFGTLPVSVEGWQVIWDDGTPHVSSALPAGTTLAPGTSLLVKESTGIVICPCTAATFYPEAPPTTPYFHFLPPIDTGTQRFTVGLRTRQGVVIDEVRVASSTGGLVSLVGGGVGGHFRGKVARTASTVAVERIWGLDSNSAGDWTAETVRSFGLENRSSGTRGYDPVAVPTVLINELDDSPDYVELRNRNGSAVDLRNWFLVASGGQGLPHRQIRPFVASSLVMADDGYVVLGNNSPAPAETQAGIPYLGVLPLPASETFPFDTEEYDCALYDAYGRLVDLVRTTGHDDLRVHNHPRAPAPWSAFGGAAGRGAGGCGCDRPQPDEYRYRCRHRLASDLHAHDGCGEQLGHLRGLPGLGQPFDVRLDATATGGGLCVVLNAGPAHAADRYSLFFSGGHLHGAGPFFGLGTDAISNWLAINSVPPFAGALDARGSARIDLPPGTIAPGVAFDGVFILQGATGNLLLRTPVIEFDS